MCSMFLQLWVVYSCHIPGTLRCVCVVLVENVGSCCDTQQHDLYMLEYLPVTQ